MVFESVVAYFLDQYLSNYIEDFDSSNLKIGIWNGNVTLENLHLKSNALDELELPVKIVFGHLKKLTLKIPWKSLYTESVKASIDGLTILVAPKSSLSFDEDLDKKELRDRKLKEVKRLIELEKSKAKTNLEQDDDQKSDTFGERIQMQVMRNLELEIKNIHIRYEDDFTKPKHPFSAGVTLNSIEIKTTDENWQPTYLKEKKVLVNKIATLVSFAVYWNSDDKLLKSENIDYSIRVMQNMITNFNETEYILKPLSLSSKTILNMKPSENEFSSPLFNFTVILESISLSLNRIQYFDMVNLLDTIDYMFLNAKYQKYRIKNSKDTKEKELWKFAYNAICETIIKTKKDRFKWTKIKLFTKTRKDYVNILKKKSKNSKLSPLEAETEKNCEEILDVFNLMLARKQADVQIARLAKKETSSSWWGWLSSSKEENKGATEDFALSSEEKEKLYNAIGYNKENNVPEYPENFVGLKLKFLLKKFELELINADYKDISRPAKSSKHSLLHLKIENMEADLMQYPVTKGFGINSNVKSINLNGSLVDFNSDKFSPSGQEKIPALIEADLKQEKFLEFSYLFNPKDKSCNKRLSLSSKSLKFIYHAITINNIVGFFRSPETSRKNRIKNAALESIYQAKERSVLYMKNSLKKIEQIEVNVDILPSYLIVPKNGNILDSDKMMFLNFGHLSFKSEARDETSSVNNEQDNQVIQASYWKYKMELTQIQILLINELNQIEMVKNQNDKSLLDKLYILTPLDISLNIHQCVFKDDVTLPELKIFGNLPLIEFNLTDLKIEQIIVLFLSIPFPNQKVLSKVDFIDTSFVDEAVEESQELPISDITEKLAIQQSSNKMPFFSAEKLQQALNLQFSFEINEINLILKETNKNKFDFLSFNIKSFGTKLLQKSYDTCIDIYLREIKCEYGLFNDTDGSNLYLLNSSKRDPNCNLVNIKMTLTDSQSPTLKLLHDNVMTNIELDLYAIDLVVNLVALKNMMDFINDFQDRLSSSQYLNFEKEIKNFEKRIKKDHMDSRPLLGTNRIQELLNKQDSEKSKKRKNLIDFDLIETKVKANFEGLRARLSTSKQDYFCIDINNLKLNSIGKIAQNDINFSLNSINVIDLEKDVVYNKILCAQEESQNLFNINLTIHNAPSTPLSKISKLAAQYQKEIFYFKNYKNQNHFDLTVEAKILKIKTIFLYANMNKLMGLLRIVENKRNKESAIKSQLESENEPSKIMPFEFLYRIKLDIDIEAPLVIVPESLISMNALMLDCGHLTIQTELEIDKNFLNSKKALQYENRFNDDYKLPPVIEIQNLKLSKMEISRILMDNNLEILNQIVLVNCSQLNLTVRRNLQPLIYPNIQSIYVKAEYGGLVATLARSDYSFVIQLLQNLSDKSNQFLDLDIPEFPINREIKSQIQQQMVETRKISVQKTFNVPKITVNLAIESIQLYLHDETYSQIDNKRFIRLQENAFSNMELKNLNLEMNLYEDTENERDSLKVMFLLDTINLEDASQLKSAKKPIRLIEKYSSKKSTFGPMVNIQYEQRTIRPDDEDETQIHFVPEKKINFHLSYMRVCLNIDYLLTLYEFFVEGIPKKNELAIDQIDLELSDQENFNMNQRLFCDIMIENPQFIFYEDQNELVKSNSFIIDALIRINFNSMNKRTKISFWIDDLTFRLRCSVMKKILTRKTCVLLSPTTVSFSGSIQESGEYRSAEDLEKRNQFFMLDVQKINLKISPQILSTFIKMINSIQNSMNKKFIKESEEVREQSNVKVESLFQTVVFNPNDFWFTKQNGSNFSLQTSPSLVSSQSGFSLSSSEQSSQIKNQVMIRTENILIKLESGLSDQQPLLCLNISMNGELNNWTYKPSLSMNIVCQMAYFNEPLSVWEPVIELIEDKPDHLKPFEILIQMVTNIELDSTEKSKKEKRPHFANSNPVRTFQVDSTKPLQFVVTKTFLSMLDTFNRTFVLSNELLQEKSPQHLEYFSFDPEEEIILEKLQNSRVSEESVDTSLDEDSPSFDFLIKNDLGFDVVLKSIKGFRFQNIDSIDPMRQKALIIEKINLKNNSACPITLEYNLINSFKSGTKSFEDPDKVTNTIKFSIEIEGNEWEPVIITLNQSSINGFNLNKKTTEPEYLTDKIIICETVTKLDKKRIFLRSPVQIINRMNIDIALSYPIQQLDQNDFSFSKTTWKDTVITAGRKWTLPIELTSQKFTDFVRVAPVLPGVNYEKSPISWYSKIDHRLFEFDNHIFFQAIIEKSIINVVQNNINKIDYIYNITLEPQISIYNYLPYPIKYEILNEDLDSYQQNTFKTSKRYPVIHYLKPGANDDLINGRFGSSLCLKLEDYFNLSWSSSYLIEFNNENKDKKVTEETNMIEFRSSTSKIITIYCILAKDNYRASLKLFAPYWILNQTKLLLDYKFEDTNNEIHTIDTSFTDKPFFLKINSKNFNSKNKKLMIRVNEHIDSTNWSDAFAIDAVGNNGTVSSMNKNEKLYQIGVEIKLQKSSNGLTKIIKFTPYYLIINQTNLLLDIRQVKSSNELSSEALCVESNSIIPFWPSINYNSKEKSCICFRVLSHRNEIYSKLPYTKPFWYNNKHTTMLTFSENSAVQALVVECIPSQEIVRIVIKPYEYGMAPVLVLNYISDCYVVLKQNEEPDDETFLIEGHYFLKTWKNPTGKRELLWSCGSSCNQIYNLDTLESRKTFEISKGKYGYHLSFLDGLQKVLIFTDSLRKLNEEIVGTKPIKGDEYVLSLKNLGLSLIDDINQKEILYFSITSSSIDWGERTTKKKIFKSFPTHRIERIEKAYQNYLQEEQNNQNSSSNSLVTKSSSKLFPIDEEDEADFERMVLYTGKQEIPIERQYAPGLYINFFNSSTQTTVHLVIHKLQIDNQLYDCVFPVLFSKILPPKSMNTTNVIKPIIELSMVQNHSQQTKTTEMKYFQVLIQEFSVKIDINLLNAFSEFLTTNNKIVDKKNVRNSTDFFNEINEIKKSFHDVFETIDNLNENKQKNDKIFYDYVHISPIKMHFSFSLAGTDAFKDTNIFLNNPLAKSIGLVLTDIQDAIFKLGYFEISNTVYTSEELRNKAIDHYKNQVVKQSYIIFLGLDVLGNPYGFISGIAEGLKSLFYEPAYGIVQGPGEFIEGVSLGVKSFAGSTIGGAAGAFSKITGTLGKGLATLTMDKEFQKSRQKASDAKGNIAQSFGKNLVKGVASGFYGMYEKPKEGLAEGGLGVIKGFGKGIIGLVAKPSTGLIDFTSQSFEGVRKITLQEESVDRSRPPRPIYNDKIIRSYKLKEAQAVYIYKTLEKSTFLHDEYKASIETSKDHNEFLIATHRHLFLVKSNTLFGNWKLEWNFEYQELLHEPRLVKNSIEIILRKQGSSFFGPKEQIKKNVTINNEVEAIRFLSKVEQAMNEKDF